MARTLIVQKHWGFALDATANLSKTIKRGQPVVYNAATREAVDSGYDTANVNDIYICDKIFYADPTDINPLSTDTDSVYDGDKVILRSPREGYYLVSGEFFADATNTAEGDLLYVDADGKFAVATTQTPVAKVLYKNQTATGFEFVIGPAY